MLANKIKKPILLIHGEEDNNPGTLTMQVRCTDVCIYCLGSTTVHLMVAHLFKKQTAD
jgi:hypothetical protein